MKPEVQALLAKARESESAARLLASEDYFNFAASRAYYAMFYAAEAILLQRDLAFSAHSAVIAAFGRELAKTGLLPSLHHQHLLSAFNMRNVGDYDLRADFSAAQVEELLGWAHDFILAIENFLQAQP